MAYVRHGTLVADTVTTVQLPDRNFGSVEVINVDGAAAIYFLVLKNTDAATNPTVEGNDCEVLPATINGLEVSAPDDRPVRVKLISTGIPKYSVRAE